MTLSDYWLSFVQLVLHPLTPWQGIYWYISNPAQMIVWPLDLLMVLAVAAAQVVIVVVCIRYVIRKHTPSVEYTPAPDPRSSLAMQLNMRLAQGEITLEEYEAIRKSIRVEP